MLLASFVPDITQFVISIFAYVLTTTVAGMIIAHILKKCGDATAIELGFGEFNPFIFIDAYGALAFLLLGIGWGKMIPLAVVRLPRSYFPLRFFGAVYAEVFAYMIVSFLYACAYVISSHFLDTASSFNNLLIQFFSTGLIFAAALTILRFLQETLRYIAGMYYWFTGNFNEYAWQEISIRVSLIALVGVYFFLGSMTYMLSMYLQSLFYAAGHLFGFL